MTTLHSRKSSGRSPLRLGFFLIPLVLVCFALPPKVKADIPCQNGLSADGCFALHNATFDINFNYTGPAMFYDAAVGDHALFNNNTGGNDNSAFGFYSLYSNTTGSNNTAAGYQALYYNKVGSQNTATGSSALTFNYGSANTANGYRALYYNQGGAFNTANGYQALYNHQGGIYNTANGSKALWSTTNGSYNTADGANALYHNTGGDNVALGSSAGSSLTTGFGNVCIGYGVLGVAGESNTTRIKNIYASVASARAVYVNADNKIGTLASTRRVKENIKPMDKASEAILTFRPVSFRYKKEIDASRTPQFGLIAEDVADINPDLVTRDAEGKPETVRYDSINAMLLNEFLKEHREVQEQKATIAQLKSTVAQQKKDFQATVAQQQKDFQATAAQQQKEIKALTTGLQKVSDQLELSKPAPRTALNNMR